MGHIDRDNAIIKILDLFALEDFVSEDFMSEDSTSDEKIEQNNVKKLAQFYSQNKRHQYHIISRYIYSKMKKGEDAIDYMLNNIETTLDYVNYNKEKCADILEKEECKIQIDELVLKLQKLYDHISLEEERLVNNSQVMEENTKQIKEDTANTFQDALNQFQERVQQVYDSLNTNIISVVGLFSAIIFVFFGGISGVSSIAASLFELEKKPDLILPMIVLLAIGFVMFNIIFLLLYAISKLTDKNIGCVVPRSIAVDYFVKKDAKKYIVCSGEREIKVYDNQMKAEHYAATRRKLSRYGNKFFSIFRRLVLRFPYVFIVNMFLVVSIIYLYIKF